MNLKNAQYNVHFKARCWPDYHTHMCLGGMVILEYDLCLSASFKEHFKATASKDIPFTFVCSCVKF